MSDHAQRTPPSDSPHGSGDSDVSVQVSISDESSDQVALQQGDEALLMQARAIKERDAELISAMFLPRNTTLDLEFRAGRRKGESVPTLRLQGMVRKVHMINASPAYAVWVDLGRDGSAALADWRQAWIASSGS